MEKIGNQRIWSYVDDDKSPRVATNATIRAGVGHRVSTYFQLAKKVAELQFLNRDHVLLFRGQGHDYRSSKGNSTIKPSLFRLNGTKIPTPTVLTRRFRRLQRAESSLVAGYIDQNFLGLDRLKRHRILRWAILQHYEVCATPLLDVTQSLRVAASFSSMKNATTEAFVFVFGVPNLGGAVTASSEANLQIVRLASVCPPEAVRPHLQEGYLLGEYPEIANYDEHAPYHYYEMDFCRRLIAKFRFDPTTFWSSKNFPRATDQALLPTEDRDPLLELTQNLRHALGPTVP